LTPNADIQDKVTAKMACS